MWKSVAALAVFSIILWLAAEIGNVYASSARQEDSQEEFNVSMAIRIIFPCNILFSMLSFWFLKRSNVGSSSSDGIEESKPSESFTTTSNRDVWWIFVPSLSLFTMLLLRLVVGIDHFQTYPPNLDFGPKYGVVYSDTGLPVETNIAFDPELNTVTHCVQGILAAVFAYVSGILAQREHQRWRIWELLASLAASALTIYPVYNFIKRVTVKDPETFATSSFSNNATEWALGFVGGMALGQCLQTFAMMRLSHNTADSSNRFNLLSKSQEDEGPESRSSSGMASRIVTIVKTLLGVLLILSVFGAAILYGYSWNNCEEIVGDNTECILDSAEGPSIPVIACFAAIPVVLNVLACCWIRRS